MESVQITYRELDASEALSDVIREEAAKLERFYDRILTCHVFVERLQRHLRSGAPFRVRIEIGVPGSEISVDTTPSLRPSGTDDEPAMRDKRSEIDVKHKDPVLAVRDAFRRARRRVQDYARCAMGPHVRSSVR